MAASMMRRTTSECSEGSGANDGELLQELGLLEAIYVHELSVVYNDCGVPSELSVILHPATAGNVDQQYVCLTLTLGIPQQYPNDLPEIAISNSRGISDEHLVSLGTRLNQLANERRGGAMLYELIEVAKESLTNNNSPSCQCVICLHGFTEADVFTKTACYHYFHSHCLARYLGHAQENEEEPVCAVCREPVTFDLSQLDDAPPPRSGNDVYTPDQMMCDMQGKMAALYRRQKEKGGIIDVEAENDKYLIHISQTPTLPHDDRVSPINMQPTSQSDRRIKIDSSKAENPHQEDNGSTGMNCAAVDRSERPRSPFGSNYKPGGRGRGWRGRGQMRPGSSGAKNYYPKSFRSEGAFRGKSGNVDRWVKKLDENLDQSQVKDVFVAGEKRCQRDVRNRSQWKRNQRKHLSVNLKNDCLNENPQNDSSKLTSKSEKDLRDGRSTFNTKSDETKQSKDEESGTCSAEAATNVGKLKIAVTEEGSSKYRHNRRKGNRPELRKSSDAGDVGQCQTRDGNKSANAEERFDGAETDPSQVRTWKNSLNTKGDHFQKLKVNESDGVKVVAHGAERKAHRRTNRNRENKEAKNRDWVERSKSRDHDEGFWGRPELDARERGSAGKNDETKSTRNKTTDVARSPPPGFGEIGNRSHTDSQQRSVKPPPGFEHITL